MLKVRVEIYPWEPGKVHDLHSLMFTFIDDLLDLPPTSNPWPFCFDNHLNYIRVLNAPFPIVGWPRRLECWLLLHYANRFPLCNLYSNINALENCCSIYTWELKTDSWNFHIVTEKLRALLNSHIKVLEQISSFRLAEVNVGQWVLMKM